VSTDAAASFGLVGALAAFPRRLAARAVADAGCGRLHRGQTRGTTQVVFGRRLLERGEGATIAAQVAAACVAGRTCLSENGFLRTIGLLPAAAGADLTRDAMLAQSGVPARDFDLLALFDAFESDRGPFSFRDLILARKYAGLLAGGAEWSAIARSVTRGLNGAAASGATMARQRRSRQGRRMATG